MPTPSSRNSCACSYISTSIPARCNVSAVAKPPIPPPTMIIFMELSKRFGDCAQLPGTTAYTGWSRQREDEHGDAKRLANNCCQMRDGHLGCTRAEIPSTSWVFFSSVTNSARGALAPHLFRLDQTHSCQC